MRTARATVLGGFGACLLTLVAACGASPSTSPLSPSNTPMVVAGSAAKAYATARDLAQDASALVIGQVQSSEAVTIQDLTFTRYEFVVTSRLGGVCPDVIDVYQVGAPGWVREGDIQAPGYLQLGATFALFVHPTELPPGTVGAAGYDVVGPGAWADAGGSEFTLWRQPGATSSTYGLPTTFGLADAPSTLALGTLGAGLQP